jgi:NTP pyrophosphatase (non-canonical NTP hydrolase)
MNWQAQARLMHETIVKRWEPYSPEDQRFLALALSGEVGEFANIVKKLWRGDPVASIRGDLADELADIRIYLELLARAYSIDLDAACESKLIELYQRWPEAAVAYAQAVREEHDG